MKEFVKAMVEILWGFLCAWVAIMAAVKVLGWMPDKALSWAILLLPIGVVLGLVIAVWAVVAGVRSLTEAPPD